MYFKKLNINLPVNQFKIGRYVSSFRLNDKKEEFKGTRYNAVSIESNKHLLEIFPEPFRYYFRLAYFEANCAVRPHIDHGPKTSINIYLKTDNCKTSFYRFIDESKPRIIPLDTKNLEEVGSFIAKDGEAWILNVAKPHSVEPLDNTSFTKRTAVCMQSDVEYDTVLGYLKKYIE